MLVTFESIPRDPNDLIALLKKESSLSVNFNRKNSQRLKRALTLVVESEKARYSSTSFWSWSKYALLALKVAYYDVVFGSRDRGFGLSVLIATIVWWHLKEFEAEIVDSKTNRVNFIART
ncbi:MAG: hypothetical protein GY931_04040 [Maribacter sp.]|nr:hypothetical protein [Maribacter sp.]